MPFNGSGSFSPPGANYPAVANTLITAANRNAIDADFATGLSTCITKDGQTTVTANIPLGGFKLTGLGAGATAGDSVRYEQVLLLAGGTITGAVNFPDSFLIVTGSSDATKKFRFEADGITAGQTRVLTAPDRDLTIGPVSGTEQATTSGTSIDFTGIPSWVRRITISFVGVSTNGTDDYIVQIGDSGGVETTGYLGAFASLSNAAAVAAAAATVGFGLARAPAAASICHGQAILTLEDVANFTWTYSSMLGTEGGTVFQGAGSKSTSAALDRVRITTSGGTNTFDAGAINILYE